MSSNNLFINLFKTIKVVNEIVEKTGEMPNIKSGTMGGKVFWNELARSADGWVVQQNKFTHFCRILDEQNCRQAWGSKEGMLNLFHSIKAEYDNSGKIKNFYDN